jgi:hypothetical protein
MEAAGLRLARLCRLAAEALTSGCGGLGAGGGVPAEGEIAFEVDEHQRCGWFGTGLAM